jgi:hypothetical protein
MEGINPAIRILVSCNLNFNSTDRNPQKQLQNFRIWINALFTPTPAVNTRKGTAKLNHGDTEARRGKWEGEKATKAGKRVSECVRRRGGEQQRSNLKASINSFVRFL